MVYSDVYLATETVDFSTRLIPSTKEKKRVKAFIKYLTMGMFLSVPAIGMALGDSSTMLSAPACCLQCSSASSAAQCNNFCANEAQSCCSISTISCNGCIAYCTNRTY
ncbi:MAG: hypothetical protein JWL77_3223 [Chthonomonadaceae bacterium]|nr:hypothetical protein [Chthonomonadaceae bacterium]